MDKFGTKFDKVNFLLPNSNTEGSDEEPRSFSTSDETFWEFLKDSSEDEVIDIVSMTEEWAIAMQKQLSRNIPLELIWLETFNATDGDPDSRGLVRAVGYLSRCWEHGAALREIYDNYQKTAGDTLDDSFYDHGVL